MRAALFSLAVMLLSTACGKDQPDTPDVADAQLDTGAQDATLADMPIDMPAPIPDLGPDTSDDGPDVALDTGPPRPVCSPEQLGVSCAADPCECEVAVCYASPLLGGKACAECGADSDCAATTGYGCNVRNLTALAPPTCSTTGNFGEGCESDEACADAGRCAMLMDVPGIFTVRTCGECATAADCQPDERCVPDFGDTPSHGHFRCVAQRSVPNDEGCNLIGDGSECVSEQCAPVTMMGITIRGVCSPCNEDADCPGATNCQLPTGLPYDGVLETPGACI